MNGSNLITGSTGTGKTTLAAEFTRRGLLAYNADVVPGLCSFRHPITGVEVVPQRPLNPRVCIQVWSADRLTELLSEAGQQPVFLCGYAGNRDALYDRFTQVFELWIPRTIVEQRVAARVEHGFGRDPAELEMHLTAWAASETSRRAIRIDVDLPVPEIADDILQRIARRHPPSAP